MSIVEKLIDTQEFATLPPVAARVLSLLEDENIDIRDISTVVETDASLTMKLLRVANSPLYATRNEINSIHQAIITLGLNRLTNIVLGVSIFSKFLLSSQHEAAGLMENFWWHSSCTGMVAKSLTNKVNKQFKEYEFIGGLLHKIGKLAMIQYDSKKYNKVIDLVTNHNMTDLEAEKEIFDVSHPEVGSAIAKNWKLPLELYSVITYYHDPYKADANKGLTAIVTMSDLLCEMWDAGFYSGLKSLDLSEQSCWKIICESYPEMMDVDLEVLTFELEQDFKKSSEFLNLLVYDS